MARKHEPAPELLSEGEERAHWESHGSVDHVDWSKATRAHLPNLKPSEGHRGPFAAHDHDTDEPTS